MYANAVSDADCGHFHSMLAAWTVALLHVCAGSGMCLLALQRYTPKAYWCLRGKHPQSHQQQSTCIASDDLADP